ncbi:acetate/propionate family kinase [Anaerobium acetethylicum]|uniref:Acetate kinase n=1 Tax=Anaerobium acetethylicum TaxID=1619234 RepID=A0A1D3TYD3_9FIRM|nr:acetate kinase [Anaerobium acetethylicum]SCP99469.1 acetate kinase [Anaerobium acetethylicum]
MNVLIINCGSSSLKFQLIDSDKEMILAKGICERIGSENSRIVYQKISSKEKEITEEVIPTHKQAIEAVLNALSNKKSGVIQSLSEVDAVGHRVVHGGEKFAASALLTDDVIKGIKECSDLAPLHNPVNLIGIEACKELMGDIPMVGVFDTAFHQSMSETAYLYGLPYELYEKYKIRRYGFHGTSHSFVSKRTAEFLGKDIQNMKIIVCHLGNGASITAVEKGKSVDTSMGFTPLEGLVMGTRSGDLDPGIMEFLLKRGGLDIDDIMKILNKSSGVLGLSNGLSSDFRDLGNACEKGNKDAIRAEKVFRYRAAKYIGAYVAAMNGVDAIAFTGGIGENAADVRSGICQYLGYLGVVLNMDVNMVSSIEAIISASDSKIPVVVIPTNEELAICRETVAIVHNC